MSGANLQQLGRRHGDQRFYDASKARRSRHGHHRQYQQNQQRSTGTVTAGPSHASPYSSRGKAATAISGSPELENRVGLEEDSKNTAAVPVSSASPVPRTCNLERFLKATTPSVPAQYPSKMKMGAWRASDAECRPFFVLADLWESFAEWSAYGAGVPLVLNDTDSVIQYYVPFLSGIQLYGTSNRPSTDFRRPGEESDGDSYRDSSSDVSSDYEHEKGLRYSKTWDSNHVSGSLNLRMDRLCLREKHGCYQDGSSSDDGDLGHSQPRLLFEFLEQDPPFIREPLSDKISDLARRFPALNSLRNCDLLPSSWISVAWYPIYRIPTGPTLKDLDACFLTFHSLSTPLKDAPIISSPQGVSCARLIPLPVFGLASYKFKGSIWTPNAVTDLQLPSSLLKAAENWVRHLNVDHPDYRFFTSRGAYRR
ncbi:hypothetical protein Cni_G02074 [Canna indica]|uniref:DUF789 family protein n=1 Tax=Canna indica TaxID=4628 RepID=A0AAQ3JQB5_9LILI|nr:hypothetical protein Cni_G02074 [Canna indica]